MVKICPMANTLGCLLGKCIFYDSEQCICIFLRQHMLAFETHLSSHLSLLLTHGYQEISGFLDEQAALEKLSTPAKMLAVYLEFLRRLSASPDLPKKSRAKIQNLLEELKTVFEEHEQRLV